VTGDRSSQLNVLVLDSVGLSRLAARTKTSVSLIRAFTTQELWPPLVPTMVLGESLHGDAGRDANAHRFLKACIIESTVSVNVAHRADELRRLARTGSAVDALVVAIAEPGGMVLTGDRPDIEALAAHAERVSVEVIQHCTSACLSHAFARRRRVPGKAVHRPMSVIIDL
jgi:hypothetical protein